MTLLRRHWFGADLSDAAGVVVSRSFGILLDKD